MSVNISSRFFNNFIFIFPRANVNTRGIFKNIVIQVFFLFLMDGLNRRYREQEKKKKRKRERDRDRRKKKQDSYEIGYFRRVSRTRAKSCRSYIVIGYETLSL